MEEKFAGEATFGVRNGFVVSSTFSRTIPDRKCRNTVEGISRPLDHCRIIFRLRMIGQNVAIFLDEIRYRMNFNIVFPPDFAGEDAVPRWSSIKEYTILYWYREVAGQLIERFSSLILVG